MHASDAMLGREPPISPSGLMVLKATTAVFDGYEEGAPTKCDTHQRRGHNIHTVASFTAETLELSSKKEGFLSRDTQIETDPNDM